MTNDSDDIYVWRFPNWAIGVLVTLIFGPLIASQGFALYVFWDFEKVRQSLLGLLVVVNAVLTGWAFSKIIKIRISPDEVRWPLGFKALRPEDVEYYKVVRGFGMEWVHIQRKRGFTYRQLLNVPGGRELRRHLLEWLDRTDSAPLEIEPGKPRKVSQ